jgi:hypothetical protein
VGSTDSVLGRFNKGCCVGVLLDCTKNLRAQTLNLFHFFYFLRYVPGAIVPLLCFGTQLETSNKIKFMKKQFIFQKLAAAIVKPSHLVSRSIPRTILISFCI